MSTPPAAEVPTLDLPELPPVDAVTQPWWDATRERRLLVQACECGHRQHYPRALCTGCGRTDALGWVDAAGDGTIDSFTVVHRGLPGYDAPYVVARVRLAEGVLMLTNLVDVDRDALRCDQQVVLTWRALADGRHLPVFTRTADSSEAAS